VYEVTESLASINGLTEIELPADMAEMVKAANLPAEPAPARGQRSVPNDPL
jgi:hypothetical protein